MFHMHNFQAQEIQNPNPKETEDGQTMLHIGQRHTRSVEVLLFVL